MEQKKISYKRGCTTFVRVLQTNAWRKTLVRVFLGFYRALYLVHGHIFRWRHRIAGKESDLTPQWRRFGFVPNTNTGICRQWDRVTLIFMMVTH